MKRLVRAWLGFLCFVSFSAQAVPLKWTLQDVSFDDGGTAEGYFSYDADTQTYSDISIQTYGYLHYQYETIGLAVRGLNWGFTVQTEPFTGDCLTGCGGDYFADHGGYLQIFIFGNFTNAGGTFTIGDISKAMSYETVLTEIGVSFPPDHRSIVTGVVTTEPRQVPEPMMLSLFSLGLLGIVAANKRRTQKVQGST